MKEKTPTYQKLIEILLIEDNPGDARLIKEYLTAVKNITFNLQTCEKLALGIDIVESEYIDVVLLDLKFPDSEGLNTFQRMFAAAPHVPIIVLSGLPSQ